MNVSAGFIQANNTCNSIIPYKRRIWAITESFVAKPAEFRNGFDVLFRNAVVGEDSFAVFVSSSTVATVEMDCKMYLDLAST